MNIFKTNKMERGNSVINAVVGEFEKLVAKIESGIADLTQHREENEEEIGKRIVENATIQQAIVEAEKVKANLKKIFQ